MTRLLCPIVFVILLAATVLAEELPRSSCIVCHSSEELFTGEQIQTVVTGSQEGVHASVGLSCHDCHGGNPDPQYAEDMDSAMDPGFASNPYVGVTERADIPGACGRCHSDLTYMRRFQPAARVDQEREYWTSQHGRALRQGNEKVATCVDCHGVHGIRAAEDPQSRVYPTQVAETCSGCHSDSETMKGVRTEAGDALPVDQYGRWRRSVHAAAMFEKGDLTAPTCNDCHGNHGAAPPGFASVTYVCGQCHGREADLFRGSPKHTGFERHSEFMAEAGAEGCSSCHEPPHPAAAYKRSLAFSECTSCHGNHSVVRPTVALLAPLPQTPCAFCHEAAQLEIPESESVLVNYQEQRDALVAEAQQKGLDGELLFDWLVDRSLELPDHTLLGSSEERGQPVLRPEFARLFEKFRIGKIYFDFIDPASGEKVRDRVRRCTDCHGAGAAEEGSGLVVAQSLLTSMQELTAEIGSAERTLLMARRGGVEVREALTDLDHAIDAQIQLEVLVHTFDPEGAYSESYAVGLESARGAIESGQSALKELSSRRTGLAISSAFILLVLVGLALRIRAGTT